MEKLEGTVEKESLLRKGYKEFCIGDFILCKETKQGRNIYFVKQDNGKYSKVREKSFRERVQEHAESESYPAFSY